MPTGLLNIWREVSAFVRYSDAKNLSVAGLSTALIFVEVRYATLAPSGDFSALFSLWFANVHWVLKIAISLSIISITILVLSLIPAISRRSNRIDALISIGIKVGIIKGGHDDVNSIYFMDIARFSNLRDYVARLVEQEVIGSEMTNFERDIVNQIWVNSRICAAKFVAFFIGSYLSIISLVLLLVSKVII